ncbi:hypothetical protein CDV31_015800 [Fusarium ambrosium]|uniref:Uncharacterized protein n=1 Tax=Fusarium ambrosium TaxID=131363 RepID=A0A428SJ91_9HYPO|nr:hypothetical protein CDV31_015800 [Fusarium ambrosium]
MARACGRNFDSHRIGRVLLNKFMQQVMYLEKKMIPGTTAPVPMFAPTEKTVMPSPIQSVQPMKMLDRHDLDALAEQLGTKIKLENQD